MTEPLPRLDTRPPRWSKLFAMTQLAGIATRLDLGHRDLGRRWWRSGDRLSS